MNSTNGVSGKGNGIASYAPLGTVHDISEPGHKPKRIRTAAPKVEIPRLTADEAKKAIGEQMTSLRDFHNQLGEFCKNTAQAISTGDFSAVTVEGADRLLKDLDALTDSVEKIYDVALERAYSRLPPRRRR